MKFGGSGEHSSTLAWAQKPVRKFFDPERKDEFKFSTLEEINEYLDADLIECLECGKMCRSIGNHCQQAHKISGLEYKKKYGIPPAMAIRSKSLIIAASQRMKERLEDEDFRNKNNEMLRKNSSSMRGRKVDKISEKRREKHLLKTVEGVKHAKQVYIEQVNESKVPLYMEALRHAHKTGISIYAACKELKVSSQSIYMHAKDNPNSRIAKLYNKIKRPARGGKITTTDN